MIKGAIAGAHALNVEGVQGHAEIPAIETIEPEKPDASFSAWNAFRQEQQGT